MPSALLDTSPEHQAPPVGAADGRDPLAGQARALAAQHGPTQRPGAQAALLGRLPRYEAALRAAAREFSAAEHQPSLPYAAEWLLDNLYLVEQALRQVREDLPYGYYRQLPQLVLTGLAGYPRAFALAAELARPGPGHLDLAWARRFLTAYQAATPLTTGELWALPTMLRFVMLERLALAIAELCGLERAADGVAEAVAPREPPSTDDAVANSIRGLRLLATEDWPAFIEAMSGVDQELRRDPAGIYPLMDFTTRDRYRGVIEALALGGRQSEIAIAQEALRLAGAEAASLRARHVGHYILGEGRGRLEAWSGYRPPWLERWRRWLLRQASPVYLGANLLLTALIVAALLATAAAAGGGVWQIAAVGLLALVPAASAAVALLHWAITHALPPRVLPKLDFSDGIPPAFRTLVAVPALLTDSAELDALLRQIELHRLGNADPQLRFALLTDFADAPQQTMPGDDELLARAAAGIGALNQRYAAEGRGPFYLLHRGRSWNAAEGCWMGWERKRGKLHELNALLRGAPPAGTIEPPGDLADLRSVRYVITLDADTLLPPDGARHMVAAMAHPLNQAEFEPQRHAPRAGYSLLQPRVAIKPASANRSPFSRIFAGDGTLDLYTRAVSEVYQDLFGSAIYVGKGIYDVAAFERSLAGRIPENALLSHDLFEGLHGRVGLLSDTVLLESYPPTYLAYARRLHRWVRGDWQLLPWLLRRAARTGAGQRPSDLTAIDRWKILDNLRRSLLPPATLLILIAGWLWLPGGPLLWTMIGLGLFAAPAAPAALEWLAQALRQIGSPGQAAPSRAGALRLLLATAFLPYEALLLLSAIGGTLVRLLVTRRGMLRWAPAAQIERQLGDEAPARVFWREMAAAPLIAGAVGAALWLARPAALLAAAPLLAAWALAPLLAFRISQPARPARPPLDADDQRRLRGLARRTWLYFEAFVGPGDSWLPPDHFQESPRGLVAHRTSPTNIGLSLLASLSAYDMGYLDVLELAVRLGDTLDGMDRLERYRGHIVNWSDTRSLLPLPPRYISTVDSGNLAASLLALRQGCQALVRLPVCRPQRWRGLLDTLSLIEQDIGQISGSDPAAPTAPLQTVLAEARRQAGLAEHAPESWPATTANLSIYLWPTIERLLLALIDAGSPALDSRAIQSLRTWAGRLRHQLVAMQRELEQLRPWLLLPEAPATLTRAAGPLAEAWRELAAALPAQPGLDELPALCAEAQARLDRLSELLAAGAAPPEALPEAAAWCAQLRQGLARCRATATSTLRSYQMICDRAEALVQGMDFGFLFDQRRQIFHIGYNIDTAAMDANYYDLLASEARIASLVAIAKGDAPQSHWLHLGRPFVGLAGARALVSWSGTMFEYLMPTLLLRHDPASLLGQSCEAAVDRQIAYGRELSLPWGVSESGYYRFDADQNYQYQAFGVPLLGLKRGLAADMVVAPYASLLALTLRPQAVLDNLARLDQLGMLGRYGLYEALDYTPARVPPSQRPARVQSYMAHHQGMILLALDNALNGAPMVERLHADPRIQSVELLLHEEPPRAAPLVAQLAEGASVARPPQLPATLAPWRVPVDEPLPQALALSNGRYTLVVTSAGGGYSSWQGLDLTRWRADPTLDDWGSWIYLQDRDSGALWSACHQPVAAPGRQEVHFSAHMAAFLRHDHGIVALTELAVAPDDDVEIRRVSLTNDSDRPRRLLLCSYAEPVLAPQAADQRHPAFNKLFIESEFLGESQTLLYRRRPRAAGEPPIVLAHSLVAEPGQPPLCGYECDRGRFLGRGQTCRSPAALAAPGAALSSTAGATLDPIMALAQEVELAPRATVRLAWLTMAAQSRREAMRLSERYRAWPVIDRAFEQAALRAELDLRRLGVRAPGLQHGQQLLSALLFPHPSLRAAPETLATNRAGQPRLWPYGISGDEPILLAQIGDEGALELVQELLRAHALWRRQQLRIDLVLVNQQASGYNQDLNGQLLRMVERSGGGAWLGRRGGIFMLSAGQIAGADLPLLASAARVIVDGEHGALAAQLARLRAQAHPLPAFQPISPAASDPEPTPALERPAGLSFDNGLGGFSPDGREYVIYLGAGEQTPAPWINVVATPDFGFLASEAGPGCTWSGNSGEHRLTPWRNDPVSDQPAEAIYIRDEETGRVWSPTPLPIREPEPYLIRHGAGYTSYAHHSHGLKQELRLFADPDAPAKVSWLRLENCWGHTRRITVTCYAEWVLGVGRPEIQQYSVPEFDAETQALLARNPYSVEFGERVAFLAASKPLHGLTASRAEFLGRMGDLGHPAALGRIGLAGAVQPGDDPCAALQLHIDLPPGAAEEVYFLLGEGADRDAALRLVRRLRSPAEPGAAWQRVAAHWDELLGAVAVRTPDPAMDLLMNRWLLYQALACRIWGRSALYQSSGAFGFRDQLQDVLALLHARPGLARAHILDAAARQFEAGDVLHWWHPPSGRGVRTRCSDDLLWLPFATAHYVASTGDATILAEQVPFLRGEPLEPGQEDRYGLFAQSDETASLYEHCCRALARGATAGAHGLPLIGGGDWNDGMNRVGIHGRGESVWLGWFLYATLIGFAPICRRMGDSARALGNQQRAQALRTALAAAWDGRWYLRAFDDDGNPLGSAQSRECQIDSIAQSWAVLSGAADPERAARCMEAVIDRLVREDERLLLLFAPPFDQTARDPGYIKGYPPGIRENGGQYTHAAIWAVWALARLGWGDRAAALFQLLNPIARSDTPERARRYRGEPYVVAADIAGAPPHLGRAGWTWYTGSAGWMYRLGLEAILGLRRAGATLAIDPCIPQSWPGYELSYRDGDTRYTIRVENPDGVNRGVRQATLDGVEVPPWAIPLHRDGGAHDLLVVMGPG